MNIGKKSSPLAGAAAIALALAAFAFWVWRSILAYPGEHALKWRVPLDLWIYREAGRDVAAGGLLYDAPYFHDLPFTYPPVAGKLFQGLTLLGSDNLLIGLWQGGIGVALAVVILMVLHERGVRLGPWALLIAVAGSLACVALEPVQGTYYFGQINVFLMLLACLDLLPRRYRLPGIGIGLAAGLKLTPAYMGLMLLVEKRWAAAAISVLTFAATVAAGFVLIPDAKVFWTDAMFNSSRVGDHFNRGGQAVRSLMERYFHTDSSAVWLALVLVIIALNAVGAWVALRAGNRSLALAFTGLGSCLVSPFAWYHHFVWVVPLLTAVLADATRFLAARLTRLGVAGAQLAGLLGLAWTMLLALPWVAIPFAPALSYRGLQNLESFQPWASLWFSAAGMVYMVIYVVFYFATRAVRGTSRGSQAEPAAA